jgi:hypothetical protein
MMIKGINSNSQYVNVTGGYPSNMPYINASTLSAGSLRYNPGSMNMEVYDGNSWMPINSNFATVDLPDWVKASLDWAHQRMLDEKKLDHLCDKYPGLAKARDNYELFKQFVNAQEQADDDSEGMRVVTSP